MGIRRGPNIVRDGLVFAVDAANPSSYVSGSTIWKDQTINQNDGTLVNDPTFNSDDQGSIDFDGADDYAEVMQDGKGSVFETQTYTIESWIKLDNTNGNEVIFSYDFTAHSQPYYAAHLRTLSNGRLFLGWNNGSAFKNITAANGTMTAGAWLHVVGLYESGRQTLYVNGEIVKSGTSTHTITFYNQEVWIGKGNFGGEFGGNIASVKFYNRALSATEVAQNYNALKGRFGL